MLSDGFKFRLSVWLNRIWVRVALFSAGGVVSALLTPWISPFIPGHFKLELAAGSVDAILNILAASMLSVTTFSLAVMVQSYGTATSSTTPRAIQLLIEDPVAQNTLATFVGAFLFSIVGIIGLAAGYYSDQGRIILFFATLAVLAIITGQLLRWIQQLSSFGRVRDTISRIEKVAVEAASRWGSEPRLGAQPCPDVPLFGSAIGADLSGYVDYIDMEKLDKLLGVHDLQGVLLVQAGTFVMRGDPLLRLSQRLPAQQKHTQDKLAHNLHDCFSLSDRRSFSQDPRFGLIVLCEVALRALSPAVNDPGTAIDVLRAGGRVFESFHTARANIHDKGKGDHDDHPSFRHLYGADLDLRSAYREFFAPIARDGGTLIEVQATLQDVLRGLARTTGASAPAEEAREAMVVAERKLPSQRDRRRLRSAAGGTSAR